MKKIFIILFISNNLLAQDMLDKSFGSENLETLNYSFSKKDLIKKEENKTQIAWGSNPRNNRFGAGINIGGPSTYLSVSLDYFITSSVNIEAGVGILGAFGGMKYHFLGSKNTANWTPYLGLFYSVNSEIFDAYTYLYIPLGLQYTGNKGFTFAVELAGRLLAEDIPIWGAIKMGHHF